MNQTGDSSNFVQISDAGSNNTYNLTQNTAAGPSHVELEIDRNSIQRHPKALVEKQDLQGAIIVAIGILPSFTASFADLLGVLSYFGMPRFATIFVSLPAGAILAMLSAAILGENFNSLDYWVRSKFLGANEPKHIGPDRFLEVDERGDCLTYSYTASCLYPKCRGRIIVVSLPPREHERYPDELAGLCSIGGQAHSYLIDRNGVATPRELDWRPKDPPQVYQSGYGR
jgi:hypothetical protein